MHLHFTDPYRHRNSPVHRLDPRAKFILTVAFILSVSLTPAGAWPVYVLTLALVISAAILSDLGVGYALRRSMLALPFALAALPLFFTVDGPAVFALPAGPWDITISQAGLTRFVSIALKSWISAQAAIILTASTPFPQLLVAMRAVKTPRPLVTIFGLMWRYLFVLVDEALRLMQARAARSANPGRPDAHTGGSLIWRARVTGGMAGNLFLRAFDRADRIYAAMLSRGYDGEARSLPLPPLAAAAWGVLCAGLLVLCALVAFGYLFWR